MRFSQIMNTLVCNSKYKNKESMKLYKNIDLVQINVKAGVSEYYFPRNVDWADKVIENLVVYAPESGSGELSPIDLKNYIVDRDVYDDVYFDLYNADGEEISHNLSAQSIVHTNNYPLEIREKLSLQLSRIFFSKAPAQDGCLLIYVFWDNTVTDCDAPQKSVTVDVIAETGKDVWFKDFIDTYINAQGKRLKGIDVWNGLGGGTHDAFITLRDNNYKTIIKLLPIAMCRPQMAAPEYYTAEYAQVHPLYLDNVDVDFANSYIRKSGDDPDPVKLTITLYY